MEPTKQLFQELLELQASMYAKAEDGEIQMLDALLYMREFKTESEKILENTKQFENDFRNEISSEANNNGNVFKGFEVRLTNGRETFKFNDIKEIETLEHQVKNTKEKFTQAYKGVQKGIVQTVEDDGVKYWIDENGEMQLFPVVSYGSSFITVKKKR